ncbi:MAG: SDR family oxidoreductase [Aristaeellaceae bacterium]
MKVLVTGAAGRLGAAVVRCLREWRMDCLGVDMEDFDVRDGAAVHRAVQAYRPDAIIHCAAYTDVERAETEPEKCAEVNGMGTLNMVRAALAVDAKLMYISDSAVFSGEGQQPWEAAERPNARSVYGLTKAQGEEAICSLMTRYFIVRTAWLYGGEGEDFVRQITAMATGRGELAVSGTEVSSPTLIPELARRLCDIVATERYGVYHAVGEGCCSRADWARSILRLTGSRCTVRPVNTPWVAKMPLNGRLSTASLAQGGFERLPDWEESLNRYLTGER